MLSGLLLAAALAVAVLLPGLVTPPALDSGDFVEATAPADTANAPLKLPQQAAQRNRLLQQKQTAEALLEQLLRRTAELQAARVADWAADDYSALQTRAAQADQALGQGLFQQAIDHYRALLQGLDELDQSRPQRLAAALEAGRQALEQVDGKVGQRQFGIALALQSDNENARRGLQRSQNIEQVAALADQAEAHARRVEWQQARAAYQQALSIDADYLPAREGLERIESLLGERSFMAAMSDVLNALDAQDYRAAGLALEKAGALRPEAPEVKDAQRRLAAAQKAQRLRQLSDAAQAAASREDWAEAERLYRQALKLEPGAVSAQQGARLARKRTELHDNIDRYLQQPQRLQADPVLANAKALLHSLKKMTPPGPQLGARRDRLQRLVAEAEQRVPVRIRSDGLTDVVIYRVGRFGRFSLHEVSLRPGTYTLVGSRDGFRDVRVDLEVRPGSPIDVQVICGERI